MQWKSHSHPCPQSTLFLPHPQYHWEPILLVLSTSFQSIFMKMQAYMIHIFIVSSLLTRSLLILTVLHVASFCSTVFLGDSHESVASETPHSPCSVGNHRGHTPHTQAVFFLIGGWMVFRLLLLQTSTVCNLVHTSFPSCLCTSVGCAQKCGIRGYVHLKFGERLCSCLQHPWIASPQLQGFSPLARVLSASWCSFPGKVRTVKRPQAWSVNPSPHSENILMHSFRFMFRRKGSSS